MNYSKLCTKWQSQVFDEGSNKKWWIGISYRDFNACIQQTSKSLEYSGFFYLDIIMIMKQSE